MQELPQDFFRFNRDIFFLPDLTLFLYIFSFLCLQDTAELFFEDVRLPKDALLGGPNMGFYSLMQELPQERLIIATMGLANCEFMFEETRTYVNERKAFGKTLSKLQVR